MSGWAWIILTGAWLGALAAAVSGVALMAWAVMGQRRQPSALPTQTAAPNTAEANAVCWGTAEAVSPRRHTCDCCGYELAGLESGRCPECGWSYGTSRVPRHKRLRAALASAGLLGAAVLLWVTPTVARDGLAAAVPSAVLTSALLYIPWADSAAHRDLAARIDREALPGYARRLLAEQCADILASRCGELPRLGAAELLLKVRLDAGRAAPKLLTCLNDPSAEVRGCAVEVLAALAARDEREPRAQPRVDRPRIVSALATSAARDPSETVRRRALDGLGSLGALGRHSTIFAAALGDPAPRVREHALYALHARWVSDSLHDAAATIALGAIETATLDTHDNVRAAAVYTLGRLAVKLDRAVIALAPSLRDLSPTVRRQAAENLCLLGRRAAPAWADLMLSLNDDDPAVQEAAMHALRALRG